ncbi:MAG: acyl carrier protein, partial [Cyclobacteriaceae bacterium]
METKDFIHNLVAETLGAEIGNIDPDEEFMSLGLDSMHAIFLIDEIEREFNIEINPHSFWEYPTINKFSENLEEQIRSKSSR